MKKIVVSVVDSNTLKLLEDAKKDDLIDLNEIQEIDMTPILNLVKNGKDNVYNQMLKKELKHQEALNNTAIALLEAKKNDEYNKLNQSKIRLEKEIDSFDDKLKLELENAKVKFEAEYIKEKTKLQSEISELNKSIELQKNIAVLESETKKNEEIAKLKADYEQKLVEKSNEINNLTELQKKEISLKELELSNNFKDQITDKDNEILKLNHTIEQQKQEHEIKINNFEKEKTQVVQKLTTELNEIKREKSTLNIKQIGEDLENWCNEKFRNVSLYGFKTCMWEKDNKAIKTDGEERATKGDYIFKVYDSVEKSNLLTSAMCEMKSELYNSKNKKRNADHFSKLDKDRRNKNLDYAILISELEYNHESDAPIFSVPDYEKMYVVRPQYFITLLGIIESVGMKYSDLVTEKELEKIKFAESLEIIKDFDEFKDNLLNNSIKHINTKVIEIKKEAINIQTAASNILESVRVVIEKHLGTVRNKINDYSIHSVVRKIDKIES